MQHAAIYTVILRDLKLLPFPATLAFWPVRSSQSLCGVLRQRGEIISWKGLPWFHGFNRSCLNFYVLWELYFGISLWKEVDTFNHFSYQDMHICFGIWMINKIFGYSLSMLLVCFQLKSMWRCELITILQYWFYHKTLCH